MIGTPRSAAARAHAAMAVTIGTPMPATTRVVQMEPAPIPTLTASTPRSISAIVASAVATLPAIRSTSGKRSRTLPITSITPCECPCAVSTTSTSTCAATSASARSNVSRLMPIAAPTRRRPKRVLAGARIRDELLDVLDGDQALEPVVRVHDQELLDLVAVEHLAGRVERGADRHGDEVLLRHDLGDRPVGVHLESQIPIGENADEPAFLAAVIGDGHAADPVALHQFEGLVDAVPRRERDRVHDHAALRSLDAIDFRRLFLDAEILVDDADAALLRDRNRQPVLGHRVHRRAQERDVQLNAPGERRADVHLAREHLRVPGHEQDVVEGQGFGQSRGHLRRRAQSFSHRGDFAAHPRTPHFRTRAPLR